MASERRLAAILFTDIVGSTALMAQSEEAGLRAKARHREIVRPQVERYGGELIEDPGDQTLSIFRNALDAVNCGLAIQEELVSDPRLKLHIGIHTSDILIQDGEISGDGVNIAARICAISEGHVPFISDEVHHAVQNQTHLSFEALGEQEFKNVPRAVPVYRVTGMAQPPRPLSRRRPVALSAAALVLLVAGVFWYWLLEREPSVPRLANPTQVTTAIGLEDYPAWSADGRTLTFESKQAGSWDIWISQTGGGQSVNRTADHDGADRYPNWSPDGAQIAFWSDRDGGGYFVMPALGGAPAKLASTPGTSAAYHSAPEWAADGTELAYINYERTESAFEASLEIISPVTRETRRVQLPGTQEARLDLSWSRDGRHFAYVDAAQQPAETTQLFVLRLSDGASVPVTDARANVRSPRWSPDGRALFFVANRVGASDLWRQRMDSESQPVGPPQQVTAGLEILHAGFSSDGARVAYSRGRWVSNVWRVPILEDGPATWANAEQITFEEAFIEFVDVSRDGRELVFSSDRAGNQDLWRMPVGGDEAIRLTTDPAPEWCPRLSPDGREITFYSYRSGDREIWVMPAEGGPARRLTTSEGLDALPEWSPDGRELSFRSERRGSSDVWVMSSTDGGDLRLLTPDAAADYGGTWSPDGEWIAYSSNRAGPTQIWRVPVAGGEPEQLTQGPGTAPRWSRDGTQIFFVGADERAGNLWSVSLNDGYERPLTNLAGRRGTPGSQPPATDGTYLYFTWRDDVGDIWVMDVVHE